MLGQNLWTLYISSAWKRLTNKRCWAHFQSFSQMSDSCVRNEWAGWKNIITLLVRHIYIHPHFCVSVRRLNSSCTHTHTHTHEHTSCYASVGHRPGILWKNMMGEIPTLWASSPHIFWHSISAGSSPVCIPAGPPMVWGVSREVTSSQDPSLFVHTIVVDRKLRGGPPLSWHKVSEQAVSLLWTTE